MFEAVEKMLQTLIPNKPTTQKHIYRDDLSKKNQICKPKKLQRSPKIIGHYREENEFSETFTEPNQQILPNITPEEVERSYNDDTTNKHNNKGKNVRVKILLTKKEVAELLAKCKEANLEFKDVVNELMRLPAQRERVDVVCTSRICQSMMLSTIIEEDENEDEDEEIDFR